VSAAEAAGAPALPADARERLAAFERALDPARPTARPGVELLGWGEVSAVLGVPELPGWVCKRMAGFRDAAAVERYLAVVRRYLDTLAGDGVRVVETRLVPLRVERRRPVVYLLQPRLDPSRLGNQLLREAPDATLAACLERALDVVLRVHRANRARAARGDRHTLGVDGQLSNWHYPPGPEPGEPELLDVGTPFMRLDGADELDVELFLAAVPPIARAWYRRQRAVERYLDDYFTPRRVLVDLLGNFHKEGRGDRVPFAAACASRWLAAHAGELDDARPVEAEAIARYYARDAAQLELFLRARRLDRWLRTRLLRQRYDFVLPGPIRR
jgi:hypothetical protein